jgi:hypothetical protein
MAVRPSPSAAVNILKLALPKTAKEAKVVVGIMLQDAYGAPDRWGNYKISDHERIQLGDKVVRHQKKGTGANATWFNVEGSVSLIDYALSVYQRAAGVQGRGDLAEKAKSARAGRKATATHGVRARTDESARKNGPGFYVVTRVARDLAGRAADHDAPFRDVTTAIDFAQHKLYELASMKLHYLLPVEVIEAQSRQDAVQLDPAQSGAHAWWFNGKYIGPKADPRQMRLAGLSGGSTGPREPLLPPTTETTPFDPSYPGEKKPVVLLTDGEISSRFHVRDRAEVITLRNLARDVVEALATPGAAKKSHSDGRSYALSIAARQIRTKLDGGAFERFQFPPYLIFVSFENGGPLRDPVSHGPSLSLFNDTLTRLRKLGYEAHWESRNPAFAYFDLRPTGMVS